MQLIFFDIGDVLFDENAQHQYLFHSLLLAMRRNGVDVTWDDYHARLRDCVRTSPNTAYKDAVHAFVPDAARAEQIIHQGRTEYEAMRKPRPYGMLLDNMQCVLQDLKRDFRLGIIANQHPQTLRIQPDEGASLEISSKIPGPEMNIQSVQMNFQYGAAFNVPIRDAYERLIIDAIRGDAALFTRNDEVEAAWGIITPIMEAWRDLSCPIFPNYAAGTWGPEAAANLLTSGQTWHIPK